MQRSGNSCAWKCTENVKMTVLLWRITWYFLKRVNMKLTQELAFPLKTGHEQVLAYCIDYFIIHSNQCCRNNLMSTIRKMEKYHVVYACIGILFSQNKKWSSDVCCNKNGAYIHGTNQSEREILNDPTTMEYLQLANSLKQKIPKPGRLRKIKKEDINFIH